MPSIQVASTRVPEEPTPSSSQVQQQPAEHNMVVGEALTVDREDSALVTLESPVLEYSVEHPGICKLIKTGENVLSLVGLKQGETRIAVVTADADGKRSIEIRNVRVASASSPQTELRNLSRDLTQSIANLYPHCRVQVVTRGEELIVQGYTESEKDARKILSLVRKTTLTPVIDQVKSGRR